MRFRRFAGIRFSAVGLVAGLLALTSSLPAAAAPATSNGRACGANEGVTVVVDFLPATDSATVGCAENAQPSILAAMNAAGFDVTTEVTGFGNYLCAIDGVAANPTNCQAFPGPYWSSFLNTADGNPGGPGGVVWTPANVGVDGGPLPVGSVVGFIQNTDGSFPGPAPRVALEELPPPDNTAKPIPPYGAASGSATAAAGWIGRQLQAGNGLLNGAVGPTVDAIYMLAAAGVGGTQIAESAAAVQTAGETYVGAPSDAPTKFAQSAKLSLALQIAGLDPAAFPGGAGTRDLLGEIRSVLNADGHFGDRDDPILHSYALIALSRTAGGVPASAVTWLQTLQCQDAPAAGAYGFDIADACGSADPDYTALAVAGLLAAGVVATDPSVAAAVAWLESQQADDGGVAGNTNSTGLAGQILAAVGATSAASAAAGFVGGLQLTCGMVTAAGSALVQDDVGAIAWKPESLADATQFGVGPEILQQWQLASVQAVLALGTPGLSQLTAAGAVADLPAAAVCAPAPTSSVVTSVEPSESSPASVTTTITTPAATSTSAAGLAATGVSDRTLPELSVAVALVIVGTLLLVWVRPRVGGRHR